MGTLLVALAVGSGCTGYMGFDAVDPTFESRPRSPGQIVVGSMDCVDYESPPAPPFAVAVAAAMGVFPHVSLYVATCTKDGGGIPWKVLGTFHAVNLAIERWDQYSRKVAGKARARGCPAVLIRRAPPFSTRDSEAIGALCVDLGQPSGVRGPMRIANYFNQPAHVLGDNEPDPPDYPPPKPFWGR
jgi:hypothetical protein